MCCLKNYVKSITRKNIEMLLKVEQIYVISVLLKKYKED